MKTRLIFVMMALTSVAWFPVSGASTQSGKKALSPATLAERTFQYSQLLSILQNQYVDSLDMESLIKTGLDAMLAAIDPYTEYFDADNLDRLTTVSLGEYGGIGSAIALRDSLAVLTDPYFGKPAAEAGIRHGDIILEIDDWVLPKNDLNIEEVSNRLKGNAGSHVRVKVRRPWLPENTDSIFVFDIERRKVSIEAVPLTTVFDDGIAYLDVSTFNRNTADDIRQAVIDIKAREGKKLKGVIIDLRDNGGGLLESAVNLLSIFLDRGTKVVETRYRDGSVETYKTRKKPIDASIPVVVMVNGNTASASEIVSGAIQDLDRGVVMGRRTYGKGLVQTSAGLGFGNVLKYTIGKYYLPSGRLVQALDYRDADGKATLIPDSLTHEFKTANGRIVRDGRGVFPDVEVEEKTYPHLPWQLYTYNWISDFANRYRNTHPEKPDLRDSLITDAVYEDFKNFVNPEKLQYGIASKTAIKYLREASEIEGLKTDSITAAIDSLEKMLEHDLKHELDANRRDIAALLESEILQRYYSTAETELRIINADEDIEAARQLLLDPERYRTLLGK